MENKESGSLCYGHDFYSEQMDGSLKSAKKVLPYLFNLLSPLKIDSIVDFGCGVGAWLKIAKELCLANGGGIAYHIGTGFWKSRQ